MTDALGLHWSSLLVVAEGAVVFSWVGAAFFFQAEDGIRDLVRSRGLGDVYKRQKECTSKDIPGFSAVAYFFGRKLQSELKVTIGLITVSYTHLTLPTSDLV